MEDQRLRLEQAHGFLVVEAVQDGLVVQRQQLFGGQRVGQGGQVLPTGLAGLGVLQAVGGKLLQQQAAGAAAVGVEPETGRQLFRAGEVVRQAFRQVHPLRATIPW